MSNAKCYCMYDSTVWRKFHFFNDHFCYWLKVINCKADTSVKVHFRPIYIVYRIKKFINPWWGGGGGRGVKPETASGSNTQLWPIVLWTQDDEPVRKNCWVNLTGTINQKYFTQNSIGLYSLVHQKFRYNYFTVHCLHTNMMGGGGLAKNYRFILSLKFSLLLIIFWFFCTVKNELNFFLSDIDQKRNVDVKFILDKELINVAIENDFFLPMCLYQCMLKQVPPSLLPSPPPLGKFYSIYKYI